jgi:hypothetical protein
MRIHQKVLMFLTLNILFCGWAMARQADPDLMEINRERIALNTTGMLVLGGWAVSNIAVGSIGMARSGGRTRYFHQMNAAWNTVNLAIAGFGYYGLKNSALDVSLSETISEFHNFEKILLFNAGLDVGYIAMGAFLWERGLRKQNNRLTGYGQSLILQGAFLFSFDMILWLLNRNQSGALMEIVDSIQFTGTGMALQVTF